MLSIFILNSKSKVITAIDLATIPIYIKSLMGSII